MFDPYLILAPALTLAVLALVRFIGCNAIFGLSAVREYGPSPTFTPGPGAVPQGQGITISADPGVPIYYTLDGTDPATTAGGSTLLYTGPVPILVATKIRAIADYNTQELGPSHIAEADYTLQPAFRQVATKDVVPSSPSTVTTDPFLMPVVQGNTIVVWIWYNSNAATVLNVQDSGGNSYSSAVAPTQGTGLLANYTQEIWYGVVTNAPGGLTVTANFQGTPFTAKKAIFAHEYEGLNPAGPFEAGNFGQGVNAAAGATVASAPVTTMGLIAFGAGIFSSNGFAAGNFTARVVTPDGNLSEDQIPPAMSPVAASFFLPNGGDWLVQVATFK